MTFCDDQEVIDNLLAKLLEICKPYGVIPEVVKNLRAKYRTTLKDELEVSESSVFEKNPAKFEGNNVGYIVILTQGHTNPNWSETDILALKDKILNSNLGVARVQIELVRQAETIH